jgi:hypothetical protein
MTQMYRNLLEKNNEEFIAAYFDLSVSTER